MELYVIIACIIGVLLQSVFIVMEKKKKYISAVILKGSASLCFIFIGCLAYYSSQNKDFSLLVLIGLIFGGLGDILLNLRFVLTKISSKVFIIGVLSFLTGHILYLCALIPLSTSLVYTIPIGIFSAIIILLIIFKKLSVKLSYKIFGILYIGAVVVMTSIAIGNLITSYSSVTLLYAIGALLFTVSDIVLIFNSFGPKQLFSLRITNLSLYYIGQILIALSMFYI